MSIFESQKLVKNEGEEMLRRPEIVICGHTKMKIRKLLLCSVLLFIVVVVSHQADYAQQKLPCPAVDAQGSRPMLNPVQIVSPREKSGDRNIDDDIAGKAIEVIGFFEAGGADPWANVSNTDTISIGFMQWNWGTKSIITTLIKKTSRQDIESAPSKLQADLKKLKDYSDNLNSSEKAQTASEVISSWIKPAPDDSLVSGIRKSVRNDLAAWLNTPAMKSVQLSIMNKELGTAFFYARAWRRDTGSEKPIDARLVTYFFDLLTFNGGTQGLWMQHVKRFRSGYPTHKATIEAVTSWLASCDNFTNPDTQYKKLYALKDALKNVKYWNEKIAQNENAFDDDQIDLLVLGLLRAQLSNGNDKPRGFPGIFQADVLTRRGVIAVGGYARGSENPITFF